jgi:hypothetical protein
VAASAIPVLSGIPKLGTSIAVVAGVLGACIAVSSGVSALFKFHELWIEYRSVAETLRHHRFLYLTRSRPYHEAEADAFAQLVEAVEGVISKENSSWSSRNRETGQKTPREETPVRAVS